VVHFELECTMIMVNLNPMTNIKTGFDGAVRLKNSGVNSCHNNYACRQNRNIGYSAVKLAILTIQ